MTLEQTSIILGTTAGLLALVSWKSEEVLRLCSKTKALFNAIGTNFKSWIFFTLALAVFLRLLAEIFTPLLLVLFAFTWENNFWWQYMLGSLVFWLLLILGAALLYLVIVIVERFLTWFVSGNIQRKWMMIIVLMILATGAIQFYETTI